MRSFVTTVVYRYNTLCIIRSIDNCNCNIPFILDRVNKKVALINAECDTGGYASDFVTPDPRT